MILNTILEKYKNWYQYMHENTDYFHGFSLKLFIPNITSLIENSNIRTALDYGCGKAVLHTKYSLKEFWGLDKLDKYDPGVKEWSEPPTIKYDLIFCIDVMEHIEENDIDAVLQHIYNLTNRVAFFSISTRPAKKNLPDGTNAHKTVQSEQWWHEKINNIFKDKLAIINFSL
jgi:hypothetical protein